MWFSPIVELDATRGAVVSAKTRTARRCHELHEQTRGTDVSLHCAPPTLVARDRVHLRLLDVSGHPVVGQLGSRPARAGLPPGESDRTGGPRVHRVLDLGGADAAHLRT